MAVWRCALWHIGGAFFFVVQYGCMGIRNDRTWINVCVFMFGMWFFGFQYVYAQTDTSLTFTVTPPLFQVALQPGETWSSSITAVNNNQYDLTLYSEPVLFESSGDGGKPVFLRNSSGEGNDAKPSTIADWIVVSEEGRKIPREQTVVIPFSIRVPVDASPGGHYAAILIGTRPSEATANESKVSVTSAIATLIFLRVAGDVREEGRLWQFSTEKYLYEKPEAHFTLKFKNIGNVHLQPQGDITIYNMFNKKRGIVPINAERGYGNVLPDTERVFRFAWKSDTGTWDIGRYRAEATVGYGYESKRFAQATTYFWVLPIVPLLQALGAIVLIVVLFGWTIRTYIRTTLAKERARMLVENTQHDITSTAEVVEEVQEAQEAQDAVVSLEAHMVNVYTSVPAPTILEKVDLRALTSKEADVARDADTHTTDVQTDISVQHVSNPDQNDKKSISGFLWQYRYVFLIVFLCWLFGIILYAYFSDVLTSERAYIIEELEV